MSKLRRRILENATVVVAMLCVCWTVRSASGQVFPLDFEENPENLDVVFFGTAEWRDTGGVDNSGYLSITDPLNGQSGAIEIPPLVEGVLNGAFSITADLRVGGGTGQPADGFSFNFVRNDDPLIGTGTGYSASPAGEANLPEEGSTTGLGIGFDEWQSGPADPDATEDDCGSPDFDCIGISVRVDGELLAQVPFPVLNGTLDDDQSLQTGDVFPLDIADIEEGELGWAPFTIDLAADNRLTITYKGRTVIDDVIDYERHEGTFIFGGRTGGANSAHHIDNLVLTIGPPDEGGPLDPLDDGTLTDPAERAAYVRDVLGTWVGDSNLDGEFNSADFVTVFTAGEYEDAVAGNSSWVTGDWDGDKDFTSSDFVAAFTDGGYEMGPRAATAAVPEPSCAVLMLMGLAALTSRRRKAK